MSCNISLATASLPLGRSAVQPRQANVAAWAKNLRDDPARHRWRASGHCFSQTPPSRRLRRISHSPSHVRSRGPCEPPKHPIAHRAGLKKNARNALSYAQPSAKRSHLGGAATKGAEADAEREIIVVCATRCMRGRRSVVGGGVGSRYHPPKCRNHGIKRQDCRGLRGARSLL